MICQARESEEDGAIVPDNNSLSRPSLNQFIVTSENEQLIRLDAATGEGQVIFTFDRYNDIASLPDLHQGVVYAATDDNADNGISLDNYRK